MKWWVVEESNLSPIPPHLLVNGTAFTAPRGENDPDQFDNFSWKFCEQARTSPPVGPVIFRSAIIKSELVHNSQTILVRLKSVKQKNPAWHE